MFLEDIVIKHIFHCRLDVKFCYRHKTWQAGKKKILLWASFLLKITSFSRNTINENYYFCAISAKMVMTFERK